jgi:PIN domain
MLKTVVDNLADAAVGLKSLLSELLLKHSEVYEWNRRDPGDQVVFFSPSGDYAFRDLQVEGRRLQAKLLETYRRFNTVIRCLLREQPSDTTKALSDSETILQRIIDQEEHTSCKTTSEAFQHATGALQAQIDLLKRLHDPSNGEPSYVPDTNALLYNPKIEAWIFAESPKFTLILLPTVLSELDSHKINHRNAGVRKKAETLIRQIKEYRRRGRLEEGVPILTGKINLVAIATEPGKESFLPWFDSANNDDRILAGVIEVMRRRPQSSVTLVTRDINLQNKAEFAQIPFVEPPELGSQRRAVRSPP